MMLIRVCTSMREGKKSEARCDRHAHLTSRFVGCTLFGPWLYKTRNPYEAEGKTKNIPAGLNPSLWWAWLSHSQHWESAVCLWMCCSAVCSHLYSDPVWIMLSVLYNLEYCMQNGPYWLWHGTEYKKGSAPTSTDNPLRKQRPAGSSNEYKTPHKSQAWHPALVLNYLRQWEYAVRKNVRGGKDVVWARIYYSCDRFFRQDVGQFQGLFYFNFEVTHSTDDLNMGWVFLRKNVIALEEGAIASYFRHLN